MQNTQLIANNGVVTTDMTRTFYLLGAKMLVGVSPESCQNGATTQPPKTQTFDRLLDDVAQTRDVRCLIHALRDPLHELGQLFFLFSAIQNSGAAGNPAAHSWEASSDSANHCQATAAAMCMRHHAAHAHLPKFPFLAQTSKTKYIFKILFSNSINLEN